MGDDGRDGALHEARMRLLEQVAETVDDRGFYDTRRVVRAAPDESSRQSALDGLQDLQGAGLLVVKAGADFDSDPLTIPTRGRSALTERQRLRDDFFSTDRACRIAVARWLYNVKHCGGRDGNWRHFIEAEGNVWLGRPFPEAVLAEASRWLLDRGFIRGLSSWGNRRIERPYIVTPGEQWIESESDVSATAPPSEGEAQDVITDHDNAAARRDRRLRLLLKVAATEDEQGQVHPYRLLREVEGARREDMRDALRDLEDVGGESWLTPVPDRSVAGDDPTTLAIAGREALADLQRRRDRDPAGRNAACRRAIVAWLYDLEERGVDHGDWEEFDAAQGNEWCLHPFPERVIDRASVWLEERRYVTGAHVEETSRVLAPTITSQGASWHEQGAHMTDESPADGVNVHISAASGSAVGVQYGSPGASIEQTVTVKGDAAAAVIEALDGLLEGLPVCGLSDSADAKARAAAGELRILVESGQVDTERAQSLYDRVKDAVLSGAGSKVGGFLVTGLFQTLMVLFGLPPVG